MKTQEYYRAVQELVIHLKYKDYTKFMAELEEIMQNNSEHDEAVFLLGHYAYNLGNYKLAMEYFSTAWELNKTVQEYADAIAITFVALQEKDLALSYAKTSEFLKPHPHIDYLLDSYIMNYQGLYDDSDIEENLKKVLRFFENGRYYECINSALKFANSAKDNADLFLYLGKAYYNILDYDLAYEALKISYNNAQDKKEQLKLLMELALKLAKMDDFQDYLKELSQLNQLKNGHSDNLDDKIQSEILNYYLKKDPKIQEKIQTLAKDKKPIRLNDINNEEFYCNMGMIIDNHMDSEYLSALLAISAVPQNFSLTIYDLGSENIKVRDLFDKNDCKYRSLYYENYQSSAMIIRGEGLDILIDATYENAKNSTLMYDYDNIVDCKISLFDSEVKPQSNRLLISDNKNILKTPDLDKLDVLNLDSFIAYDPPTYERYTQPPITSSKILTIGMIADKRNITPDYIASITDTLKSSKNIRVIFGYMNEIDQEYKQELISHFNGENLLDQIFFLENDPQDKANQLDLKDEFFGYIDVFLNGAKVYPQAMATALYMGISVYYVRHGLSNDSLALSILSTLSMYEEYVYDTPEDCMKDLREIPNNIDKLTTFRTDLISAIPETMLFNPSLTNIQFFTKMLELSGYVFDQDK